MPAPTEAMLLSATWWVAGQTRAHLNRKASILQRNVVSRRVVNTVDVIVLRGVIFRLAATSFQMTWATLLMENLALALNKIEAFTLPALHSADHFFDLSIEACQFRGSAVSTVAMRPVAIDDKQGIGRIASEIPLSNLAMR
jgi:hypothetical protein